VAKGSRRDPHHDAYDADGSLWDREGRRWHRRRGIISPFEADAIVREGGPWAVEWCVGGRDWHPAECGAWDDIQPQLIDPATRRKISLKAARTGRSKTVMIAEEWVDDAGHVLVLVIEGGPDLR
jgi:hypothetical protein